MERMSPQPISQAARRRFEQLVPTAPNVEVRAMFGTLAALVDGHVFALLMGERIGVKVGRDGLAELASLPGSDVLSMGGRTMRPYRTLPDDLGDDKCRSWLERARAHVAGLPHPAPGRSRRTEPSP